MSNQHVTTTNYTNWKPIDAKPLPTKPLAKEKGLAVQTCECGETAWAFPWNDELVAWDAHLRHPLKAFLDTKGLAPPAPRFSHHVVMAGGRRWRVIASKVRTRHKVELRGGTGRGLPIHRHVMGRGDCVRVINRNGCDVRRANLKRMTRKEIAADRCARKAAEKNTGNAGQCSVPQPPRA